MSNLYWGTPVRRLLDHLVIGSRGHDQPGGLRGESSQIPFLRGDRICCCSRRGGLWEKRESRMVINKVCGHSRWRFMLSLTEMGRSEEGSSVRDKLKVGFGHVKFEVPFGHPGLAVSPASKPASPWIQGYVLIMFMFSNELAEVCSDWTPNTLAFELTDSDLRTWRFLEVTSSFTCISIFLFIIICKSRGKKDNWGKKCCMKLAENG